MTSSSKPGTYAAPHPTVSIIVPTLNEEEDLPILLGSIKAQSFSDYEIIVADAGSKDRTQEIAEAAGARVVPGGMPGPGRNRGAEASRGELLFFFDADVDLPPDFLERAVGEMNERMLDLATCEFKPKSDLKLDEIMFRFANLSVKMNQDINPRAAGFCIFISARLFRRVGGFDESLKLAEDHDLVQRASKFRPLRVLKSTSLKVSIRRLEKEGRFNLVQKYMQVELHLMFKGNVRDEIVEYEFGNFANESEGGGVLDDIESRIIQIERAYQEFADAVGPDEDGGEGGASGKAFFEKWRTGFDAAIKAFGKIAKPPQ
ncbi:MAG: glycosyltransferase [bacterium]|nr:glycosyltransferase [bacterium]